MGLGEGFEDMRKDTFTFFRYHYGEIDCAQFYVWYFSRFYTCSNSGIYTFITTLWKQPDEGAGLQKCAEMPLNPSAVLF
jgi:hypothetical protein